MKVFLVVHEEDYGTEYYGAFTSVKEMVEAVNNDNDPNHFVHHYVVYEIEGRKGGKHRHDLEEYP